MLVLASILGTHAIIFPAGAALAMGIWVLGLQGWTASRWRVVALPPLFAALGVALVGADLPRAVAEIGGVAAGLILLLEWLARGQISVGDGMRRWGLLVGAGVFGSVAALAIPIGAVAGVVAVCATLALMWLLAAAHPPALAIALIPQILESSDPLTYVGCIAAGAAALYIGAFAIAPTRYRRLLPAAAS